MKRSETTKFLSQLHNHTHLWLLCGRRKEQENQN